MAALGRLLQILGWLWVFAGFIGPRVDLDLFGLDSFGVIPGLILIFIARAFRAQARREASTESAESQPQPLPAPTAPRTRRPPEPSPKPEPRAERQAPPSSQRQSPPDPKPQTGGEDDLLERIALAGRQAAEGVSPDEIERTLEPLNRDDGATKPMSSDEMIAQARARWDRRGR